MERLLFFQWTSFMNRGVERALKELEVEYETCFYPLQDWEKDDKFLDWFSQKLRRNVYEVVFSINFVPLISVLCEEWGICYCAWIYDSPVNIRNLESMKHSCNYIYCFDRGQVEEYRKQGIQMEHLPLAADVESFKECINMGGRMGYQSTISFVGKLYQTEYNYFQAPLSDHSRGYLEGILQAQAKVYGGYFLGELITDELLEVLNKEYRKASAGKFEMGNRELEFLLASEITGRERRLILSLLGKFYPVTLYCSETEGIPEQVQKREYVDYYAQMPRVFAESEVNLNISLKTIRTGIPLRILDVLGSGGFLISNYQAEMAEYFRIGEEIEIYENIEDLVEKVDFYINHENLRRKIIQKGRERVLRDFTFKERMRVVLAGKCNMDK